MTQLVQNFINDYQNDKYLKCVEKLIKEKSISLEEFEKDKSLSKEFSSYDVSEGLLYLTEIYMTPLDRADLVV